MGSPPIIRRGRGEGLDRRWRGVSYPHGTNVLVCFLIVIREVHHGVSAVKFRPEGERAMGKRGSRERVLFRVYNCRLFYDNLFRVWERRNRERRRELYFTSILDLNYFPIINFDFLFELISDTNEVLSFLSKFFRWIVNC